MKVMNDFNDMKNNNQEPLNEEGKVWREDIDKHNIDLRGMKSNHPKLQHHIDLKGMKTARQVKSEEKQKHYEENLEPMKNRGSVNAFFPISSSNEQIDVFNKISNVVGSENVKSLGVEDADELKDYRESLFYNYDKVVNQNKPPVVRLASTLSAQQTPNPQTQQQPSISQPSPQLPQTNNKGSPQDPSIIKTNPSRAHPHLVSARGHRSFYDIHDSFNKIEGKVSDKMFQNGHTKDFANMIKRKNKARRLKKNIQLILMNFFILAFGLFVLMGFQDYQQKGYFIEQARAGYYNIENGRDAMMALDGEQAEIYFSKALQSFEDIEDSIGLTTDIVLSISSEISLNQKLSSYQSLLKAGKLYSMSGVEGAKALGIIQELKDGNDEVNSSKLILKLLEYVKKSQRYFSEANDYLMYVDVDDVPEEFRDKFAETYQEVIKLEKVLKDSQALIPVIIDLLGYNREKTYLFLFQNNSELRPTGGFIGTYGLLPVYNGYIGDIKVNGIYDPDGQIKDKVIPPLPLQYVTPDWETRDSNWFLDFPMSAQKAIDFLIKSGEVYKVDGVIAVTPEVLLDLLKITGPIEMKEYNVVITEENFLEVVQQEVEVNYDKELNKPKQILADLAPIIIERVSESDDYLTLMDIMISSLKSKDLMFYTKNKKAQELLEEHNFAGRIGYKDSKSNVLNDYLSIAFANLGGGKTDAYTKNEVDTRTTIEQDGSVVREVVITRKHNGGNTGYEWYDKNNYGYAKIYVPKGSAILDAEGFANAPKLKTDYEGKGYVKDNDVERIESTLVKDLNSKTDIFEESGFTVFGNWYFIRPGETSSFSVKYKLPVSSIVGMSEYKLNLTKSPGISANYSGDFTSNSSTHIFSSCSINDSSISLSNFRFKQDQDSLISCSVLK